MAEHENGYYMDEPIGVNTHLLKIAELEKEIVELRNEKAEIEKERDKYKAHFDKEIERHYSKKKFPRQHKELKAGK
mgnify:CR=1 FL=1